MGHIRHIVLLLLLSFLTACKLQVFVEGDGSVVAAPAGDPCQSDAALCYEYSRGTEILLTATPDQGSIVSNWSIASCGASNTCLIPSSNTNKDLDVTVYFKFDTNDRDSDGYPNDEDAFPDDPTEWLNTDGDEFGNNADLDDDNDGISDEYEVELNTDPLDENDTPSDIDSDGIPDSLDDDRDGDGVPNTLDVYPNDNTEWLNTDGDQLGNNADLDDDNDGISDEYEIELRTDPLDENDTPSDIDSDGIPDSLDDDKDGDGVPNTLDVFPEDGTEWLDLDGDGEGDNKDLDRDGDGISNIYEEQLGTDPNNAASTPPDFDSDNIPDALDDDVDGDSILNESDICSESTLGLDVDSQGCNGLQRDTDNDGIVDANDTCPATPENARVYADGCVEDRTDTDGDGIYDYLDAFPEDANEQSDMDGDGTGDNADDDIDGDGRKNSEDAFPLNPQEWSDFDGDGLGDNTDSDRDGDGVINISDAYPDDPTRATLPVVTINSPATLTTVGSSPIRITGSIDQQVVALTINGITQAATQGNFTVDVDLEEGHNVIEARIVDAEGLTSTASITVSLDLTPPYLTVDSHENGAVVYQNKVSITGLINDIVRGTISAAEATVVVNGINASIDNRSYMAKDVPLISGNNEILITGTDAVGNVETKVFNLYYKQLPRQHVRIISGNEQVGVIGEVLSEPLVIQIYNDLGQAASDKKVVLRVEQGAGILAPGKENEGRGLVLITDNEGKVTTEFKLGGRSGTGNQKVSAKVIGYEDAAVFVASALSAPVDKITVNSGNNQRGGALQFLPAPFIITVMDNEANVIPNIAVEFSVTQGTGQFQNGQPSIVATTDSDGRASAHLKLGSESGVDYQRIEARLIDVGSVTVNKVAFSATAYQPGEAQNTKISGIVLDNQDNPLQGVTVRIDGTSRQSVSGAEGKFEILNAPVGPVHLLADGSTIPGSDEYPSLAYNLVTVSGINNTLPAPVYMVKLNPETAVLAGPTDIEVTIPNMPGVKLEIPAGSATFPNGEKQGYISMTAVNASKVPMAPPNGMQPQVIVTIQPTGTLFDPPARLTLPNVDGYAPGSQSEMYSFDHDLEEFVSIGLGTVSEDGTVIRSNPGVGVVKAGWHCGAAQPGGAGSCDNECEGADCGPPEPPEPPGPPEPPVPPPLDPGKKPCGGNPIMFESGEKVQVETDYVGPGTFPIRIERRYSSQAQQWNIYSGFEVPETVKEVGIRYLPNPSTNDQSGTCISYDHSAGIQLKYAFNPLGTPEEFYKAEPGNTGSLYKSKYYANKNGNVLIKHNNHRQCGNIDGRPEDPILKIDFDGQELWTRYLIQYKDGGMLYILPSTYQVKRYIYVSVSGHRHLYRLEKNRITVTDDNGNVVQLNKDGFEVINAVVNPDEEGKGLTFDYQYDTIYGELERRDSNGELKTYGYSRNMLSQVKYSDGTSKKYYYENIKWPFHLTGITDEKDIRFASWEYDRFGRAISSEHAGETEKIYLRFNPDQSTTVTNALGKQTTYYFKHIGNGQKRAYRLDGAASTNCVAANQAYEHTADGDIENITDWNGYKTAYEYDEKRQILKETQAEGSNIQREIITEWYEDKHSLVKSKTLANRKVTYTYYDNRKLQNTTVSDVNGDGTEARITAYTYDSRGNLETVDGPREDVDDITHYAYDARGRLIRITNALGHIVHLQNYNRFNQPERIVDANTVATSLEYDGRGRLKVTTRHTSEGDAITRFDVNEVGLVTKVTTPDLQEYIYHYDEARRLRGIENNAGEKVEFDVDSMGNITQQRVVDGSGNLVYLHNNLYDELSRTLKDIGASDQTAEYLYDANSNSTGYIDAKGNTFSRAFDPLNRLTDSTDALQGIASYDYDARDNLKTVIDQRRLETHYEYNIHNEVTKRTSPDTGITEYDYDKAGNLKTKITNPVVTGTTEGAEETRTIRYDYDALNRLRQKRSEGHAQLTQSYFYDAVANGNFGKGRLTSINDETGSTTFTYNDRGLVENEVRNINLVTSGASQQIQAAIQRDYDKNGRMETMVYPNGPSLSYQYDTLGRIAAINWQQAANDGTAQDQSQVQNIVSNIQYQPYGPAKQLTFGNGLALTQEFDQDYRLREQGLTPAIQLPASLQLQLDTVKSIGSAAKAYDYDLNDNITAINDNAISEANREYDYDELNRLIEESGKKAESAFIDTYDYDAVGNRLTKQSTTTEENISAYRYADDSNRLLGEFESLVAANDPNNLDSIQYNPAGSILAKPASFNNEQQQTQYRYNVFQRMQSYQRTASNGDVVNATYQYNALGQRVIKTVAATQTVFIYGQGGELLQEVHYSNGVESKRQSYIWLGSQPVAMIQQFAGSNSQVDAHIYYLHTDQLNTPRKATNQNKQLVWYWNSDAFGQGDAQSIADANNTASRIEGELVQIGLRFPGQYADEETNSYYNYFRDYDSSTGRYIQSDPIGLEGGLNTFAYVDSNPLIFIDLLGLASSGQFKDIGSGNRVRIDNPHVPDQQRHAHFETPKGNGVVNQDGSQSHKNKGRLDNMNKKVKKYLKKNGFKLRCVACVFLPPEIYRELERSLEPKKSLLDDLSC